VTKQRPGFALARATIIGSLVGGVLIGLVGVSGPVALIIAIAVALMVMGFRAWRPALGGGPNTARFLVAFAVLAGVFVALLVTTSVTAALAAISAIVVVLGVAASIQRPREKDY
jgi:hypothetical protein